MRLKLIACEVFEREVRAAVERSGNAVDVEFLHKTPHHLTDREMVQYLQVVIDRAGRRTYHAVLLVAGSCKHGLSGLEARSVPLVLPRAKDCISLLLEHSKPPHASASRVAPPRRPAADRARGRDVLTARPRSIALSARPSFLAAKRFDLAFNVSLAWREAAATRRSIIKPGKPRPPGATILDRLVNGYWNYSDFVVIAPGWRVVVNHQQGNISAEEIIP